mmetsp:Transcript_15454/g.40856  ORF Transcript_15454/g.40856 Transcript_15454/m.40856 type:complete len:213 (-) Transcript_15454:33-671(-)
MGLNLLRDGRGVEGAVDPLYVEAREQHLRACLSGQKSGTVYVNTSPRRRRRYCRLFVKSSAAQSFAVERLECESVALGTVNVDLIHTSASTAIDIGGGVARANSEAAARRTEGLHAEAELAIHKRHATLAAFAYPHHHPRQHIRRHAAAVVDDPNRTFGARYVDSNVDRLRVRGGLWPVARLGVVQAVVDELHQDARGGDVALGHVVQKQRG